MRLRGKPILMQIIKTGMNILSLIPTKQQRISLTYFTDFTTDWRISLNLAQSVQNRHILNSLIEKNAMALI